MLAQPVLEADNERWLGALNGGCRVGAVNANLLKKVAKVLGAESRVVVSPAAFCSRATTSSQMLVESCKIDVG
jgi:hypothetical protein